MARSTDFLTSVGIEERGSSKTSAESAPRFSVRITRGLTDSMADWAHRSLAAKNTLGVADAQLVETAFQDKMAALDREQPEEQIEATETGSEAVTVSKQTKALIEPLANQDQSPPRRVSAKTIRLRDKDHRKFVSTQPCLVCGRTPADPHHLRFAQPRALSRKVSDEFTVPVCRVHHRELHRHGDEAAWWQKTMIDPLPIARRLWQHARPDAMALAVDGDAEPTSAIAPNLSALHPVVMDRSGVSENVASIVTDRPTNP